MYDLVLVDPAPLPPHERTWRHPSELGPTRHDVDLGTKSHVGVLVAGTFAVLAVAALVAVSSPRQPSAPLAMSATTTPMIRVLAAGSPNDAITIARPTGRLVGSFTAYPHAIAAGPLAAITGTAVAERPPTPSTVVLVRTAKVTYRVKWWQVPMLDAPEGTVVYDLDGEVVARFTRGEMQMLVDASTGGDR